MMYALARPFLFALDPETAHHVALKLTGLAAGFAAAPPPFPVRAMGLEFPNPVGLALRQHRCFDLVDAQRMEELGQALQKDDVAGYTAANP